MPKKDKGTYVIVGLGAAALIYYFYNKNKATSAIPTVAPVTEPGITTPSTPITALPVTPTLQTGQLTTALYNPAPTPTGVPLSSQQQTVMAFFKTDLDEANLNQFMNSYPSFTDSEWAGLWDLVVNDWQGGQGNTPQRKQFWDTWRVKYHILDGTYS